MTTYCKEVGNDYSAAYDAHYKTKNMHEALILYRQIISAHPGTQEAAYSRAQVQNIVNTVVAKQKIEDTMVALALTYFEQQGQTDVNPDSSVTIAGA